MTPQQKKLANIRTKALELHNQLRQFQSSEKDDEILMTFAGHPVGDAVVATDHTLVRLANKLRDQIAELDEESENV